MIIDRISIQNFKNVIEADLGLSDMNIIVGQNGSGKSSIIQSIHFASTVLRQAPEVRPNKTSTIGIREVDYLPTNEYALLASGGSWGNRLEGNHSRVEFNFIDESLDTSTAYVTMRAARNAGISVSGDVDRSLLKILRNRSEYFTAYIPGLSGVPNEEQLHSKRVVLKSCSFGDSNVYLRNTLRIIQGIIDEDGDRDGLEWVSNTLSEVFDKDVSIDLSFSEERDLHISCTVSINDHWIPIELAGTGYLQLLQIFSYIRLFEPKILLIDEPDTHLHPDIQQRFSREISNIARDEGFKVLITTHSPFILRGAEHDANIVWVDGGSIKNDTTRESIELALGWGASGRKILIISEDKNTVLLKKLLSQWPNIDRFVSIHPGNGYRSLPTPEQAVELRKALCNSFEIIVYRDRDSMNNSEVALFQKKYKKNGVHAWVSLDSDMEAYFCDREFISTYFDKTPSEADDYIEEAKNKTKKVNKDQFIKQRRAHNDEFWSKGGGPSNDEVWKELNERPLGGWKGKSVFNKLNDIMPGCDFTKESIERIEFGESDIAPDLRRFLEKILG